MFMSIILFYILHLTGVFFVAYLVLLLTCGFPLLYMEMVLGQYSRGGPLIAWDAVPLFKGQYSRGGPLIAWDAVPLFKGQYSKGDPLIAWGNCPLKATPLQKQM